MKEILIAEDEGMIGNIYQRILSALGHETHLEPDGQSALEYFLKNQEQIGLVITDNEMGPGMKGEDLIKKIRELGYEHSIILASGTATEEEAVKAGATDFMEKPFDVQTLKAKVEEYFVGE